MPRVETDIKLDFKDVLVRPKRSTLRSRSEVRYNCCDLFREKGIDCAGVDKQTLKNENLIIMSSNVL